MDWESSALQSFRAISRNSLALVPPKFKEMAKSRLSEFEKKVKDEAESFARKANRERVKEEDLIEALKWLVPFDKRPYLIKVLKESYIDLSKYFDAYDLRD